MKYIVVGFFSINLFFSGMLCARNSLSDIMEGFRDDLPPPSRWESGRGVSMVDDDGELIPLAQLREIGLNLSVQNNSDVRILISYLRDANSKLAYISAIRLHAGISLSGSKVAAPDVGLYFSHDDQKSRSIDKYLRALLAEVENFEFRSTSQSYKNGEKSLSDLE